jgi:RNA polymerase sigma-70 factor (family 1)
LVRLTQSDEAAFAIIYNKYSPGLYIKLLRILKSRTLSEDILQDVFIVVWNNRNRIDSSKCFLSYLSCIAVHKCYDHFRKIARDKKLQCKLSQAENNYTENDQSLVAKEAAVVLLQTIELLPPKRKLIFRLCKVDGKTYEEVSKQLGISLSTISDHIVKANTFIRSRLFHIAP